MEIEEEIEVEILRVTDEGKGIGVHKNKMIIVDGVSEKDSVISVRITNVLEESAYGTKTRNKKTKNALEEYEDLKESPYEMDEDDEEEDYDY